MCGICGFNWEDKNLIKRMSNSLSHRGPDQYGYYSDKNISLGHRRLSIIDLSERGKQPMYNEDNTIAIVFNGEIYNFQELRTDLEKKGHKFNSNTDTEVIIHSYEEYGEMCVQNFNGCFGFCIYDHNKNKLFIYRDRLGKKPVYYYINKNKFIFASELKALIEDDTLKREINYESLNRFIALRYVNGKETILKDCYRILPGHYIIFDLKTNKLIEKEYWNLKIPNRFQTDKQKIKKKFIELLNDSVKKRMISDVPIGAYLSGGIDSSAIVAMMSKHTSKVNTFSVAFDGDYIGNELEYSRKVSETFNTNHKEIIISSNVIKELPKIVWHLDEPLSDPATIPNYILSKEAKKKVSVILTGDGADELFAGYDQHKFLSIANKLRYTPRIIRKSIIPLIVKTTPKIILNKFYKYTSSTGNKIFDRFKNYLSEIDENPAESYLELFSVFNDDERQDLFSDEVKSQIKEINLSKEINREYFDNKIKNNIINKINNKNFLNKVLYFDMKNYLPEDLLMKPDKMCMAFAVEARVPFLDHRFVEFSYTIDPKLKMNGLTTKYIMKKSLEGIIPNDIIYRKKQPFQVPIDNWIMNDLKPVFQELLSEGHLKKQRFFNDSHISRIFNNYNNSKLYYGRQIWSLASFEIWHKIFIEKQKINKIL